MRTYLTATIEAPDLATARAIAEDLDGADFIEDQHGHEWETFPAEDADSPPTGAG